MAEKSALAGRWSTQPFRLTLAVLLAAASVLLFFVIKLKPASAGAFAFLAVWLVLPHAAMALLLIVLRRKGKSLLPWCITSFLVTLGGIYMLVHVIYLNPDAQGAIGVVLTPILQVIAFVVSAPLAWWASRLTEAKLDLQGS